MTDWRYDDRACPDCGHSPTKTRTCRDLKCRDGMIDLYEEDPILHPYGRGKKFRKCRKCKGTGYRHWCPECGAQLTGRDIESPQIKPNR